MRFLVYYFIGLFVCLVVYAHAALDITPVTLEVTNYVGGTHSSCLQVENTGDEAVSVQVRAQTKPATVVSGMVTDTSSAVIVNGINPLVREQYIEYQFEEPDLEKSGAYDLFRMQGCELLFQADRPIIPLREVVLLVPPGFVVDAVEVEVLSNTTMNGAYLIQPASPAVRRDRPQDMRPGRMDPAVYDVSKDWPGHHWQKVADSRKRGYDLFRMNLFPMQYNPATRQVVYANKMRVHITYRNAGVTYARRPDPGLMSSIEQMVDNPALLRDYRKNDFSGMLLTSSLHSELLSSMGGPYDFIIITSPELGEFTGGNSFRHLADLRETQGIRTKIIATDWIYANYAGDRPDGSTDNQTRIRNFLRDAYQTWGTKYVLLGGDCSIVPMRTFFSPIDDTEIPCDLFYVCVDPVECSFDGDGDGRYGESNDGLNGGDVDLVAEMYVGRAPVDTIEEMQHFIKKTLDYNIDVDYEAKKVCQLGERLGFGGVTEYAKTSLEQIRLGGPYYSYELTGFANHNQEDFYSFDLTQNLYAEDQGWGFDALKDLLQERTHILNHFGHANQTTVMSIHSSNVEDLDNPQPFFAYSQGCLAGAFDYEDCIAEHLVKGTDGAFAVIMNSRYGWGLYNSTYGPSHRFARRFWNTVLGDRCLYLGEANQSSKEDILWNITSSHIRWCYYALNLLGDPTTQLRLERGVDWLSIKDESLNIDAGGISNVVVSFNSEQLTAGMYEGNIFVDADSASEPLHAIPVYYHVLSDGLSLMPMKSIYSQGPRGGPFADEHQEYILKNESQDYLAWQVTCSNSWLQAEPAGGTLPIGGVVTVRVDVVATTLPPGEYEDRLCFKNIETGNCQYRNASLKIKYAVPEIIYDFPLDNDPGWACDGSWAYGRWVDMNHRNRYAHTGPNCYGYNLTGFYYYYMPAQNLTAPPMDFRGYENIKLRYWASGVVLANDETALEISTNGVDWEVVWESMPGCGYFSESSWERYEYDLSEWAGCFPVQIRWRLGPTDYTGISYGLYLDDISISASPTDDLVVVSEGTFETLVHENGSAYYTETPYVIRNYGATTLNWTATILQNWADVTPVSGALQPGDEMVLNVCVNENAAAIHCSETGTLVIASSGNRGTRRRALPLTVIPCEENLISNPDFETPGIDEGRAHDWSDIANPETKGITYGSTGRVNWRNYPPEEDGHCATIQGGWSGKNTVQGASGWRQRVEVQGNRLYTLSGWFYADVVPPQGPWTSALQRIRMSFCDANSNKLTETELPLSGVGETWTKHAFTCKAPRDAKHAFVYVSVNGASQEGSLQFDELCLEGTDQRNTCYVSGSGSHVPPFASWETAATNIEAAVDYCADFGAVQIGSGVYKPSHTITIENDIHLIGVDGPNRTIIDGRNQIRCMSVGNADVMVEGLTLTNGYAASGAGIKIDNAQMIIRNCVITGNTATDGGAGLDSAKSIVEIDGCRIVANHGGWCGGAVFWSDDVNDDKEIIIRNSMIRDNTGANGGGLLFCATRPQIFYTTILNNTASQDAGGITTIASGFTQVDSVIIRGNIPQPYNGNFGPLNHEDAVSYVEPGIYSYRIMTTADPNIESSGELMETSPCIDIGRLASATSNDCRGAGRPLDGNNDGMPRADIGGCEYIHSDADSDHDGMPDLWEFMHALRANRDDATNDQDKDHLTNWQEYIAGTDPKNADSVFCCAPGHTPSGDENQQVIRWLSSSGCRYTIYQKQSLSADWEPVPGGTNIPGDGGTMSYTNQNYGIARMYYRIKVERFQ